MTRLMLWVGAVVSHAPRALFGVSGCEAVSLHSHCNWHNSCTMVPPRKAVIATERLFMHIYIY